MKFNRIFKILLFLIIEINSDILTNQINKKTDKFFKAKYKSKKGRELVKLHKKYEPMYDFQKLQRKLMGDPSAEEGNELGVALGNTMGGVMSLSLADTPKVVMVDQSPFYSYI